MTDRTQAIEFLGNLLESGMLKPSYDRFLQREIFSTPPGRSPSFYVKALVEQGEDAARAELAKWEAWNRRREFSAFIEPIVRGMLAVVLQDTEHDHACLVEHGTGPRSPAMSFIAKLESTLVFFNPEVPGCACSQPPGAVIFGRSYGSLEPHAILVQVGANSEGERVVALGIAMPCRGFPGKVKENQYMIFSLGPDGWTNNYTYWPHIPVDDHIRYMFGLLTAERRAALLLQNADDCMQCIGGSTDYALGYPGARNYLADHLNELGPYLTAVAERFKGGYIHSHYR